MASVSSTTIQINTTGSANGSALVSPPSPPASSLSPPSASGDNMSLTGATPPTSSTSPPTSPPSPPPLSSPDSSASSPPPNSSASPPSPLPPSSSSPPPTPPAESKAKAPPKFSPPPAPASSSGSSPPSPPPTPPASPPPSPPQSSAPSGSPPPPDQLSPPPPPAPVSGTGAVPAPAISPPPPTSSTGPSPPIASTSPPPPSAPTASGSPPAAPTNSTPTTNSGSTPPSQTSSRIPTSTSNSTSGGSSTPSSSTSTVIGAAAAGVFLVALIALVVLVLRRKKRKEGAFASKYVPPSGLSPQSDKYYYGQQPHMMGGTGHSGPYYGSQGQNSSIENSFGSQRGGGNMYHGGGGDSSVIPSSKSFFTYEELMEITNGFSHQNIIGEGGFGCVYKGWLSDGKLVAVKQLKAGSGQGDREFKAEVEIISRVHHRHLVSLVGYSMAENQRLLIYEFVPNKTLEHHLHEKGLPVLEWTKRVKIALGSAKGLAYLHEDCHPKIIHRDIKSANILLDDAFEAQVADFGLAKLTNDANTHVSTRVMGTFGYLAPEYASSGKLTDRSDVFSFGVVLLELITGRKPVDATQPLGDESLVEWARPLLLQALETGDPSELVDPRLEKNYVEGEMFRMIEAAAACIRHSAAKRPRMVQVVRALDSEGDMSDLTNGVKYGQSTVYDSGQYNEDIMKFRRMALGSGDSSDYGPYSGDYSSREVSGAQKIPWKSRDSSNEFTSSESETRAMNPLNSEKRFPGAQGGYGMRRFS